MYVKAFLTLHASPNFYRQLITFANSLDPYGGPDLDPYCLTL